MEMLVQMSKLSGKRLARTSPAVITKHNELEVRFECWLSNLISEYVALTAGVGSGVDIKVGSAVGAADIGARVIIEGAGLGSGVIRIGDGLGAGVAGYMIYDEGQKR